MARSDKQSNISFHTSVRFPKRHSSDWQGRLVDYKEVDLLRKFLTTSSKLMSRKRAGTNAQEQKALKNAVKLARFMALVPYRGS
ncbi:MAG: 30S ribosomal protein S18 [Phycisphaerae bacterium]|nr:30S ribosomal protein S18 [Phycisphaerae bacterium]